MWPLSLQTLTVTGKWPPCESNLCLYCVLWCWFESEDEIQWVSLDWRLFANTKCADVSLLYTCRLSSSSLHLLKVLKVLEVLEVPQSFCGHNNSHPVFNVPDVDACQLVLCLILTLWCKHALYLFTQESLYVVLISLFLNCSRVFMVHDSLFVSSVCTTRNENIFAHFYWSCRLVVGQEQRGGERLLQAEQRFRSSSRC